MVFNMLKSLALAFLLMVVATLSAGPAAAQSAMDAGTTAPTAVTEAPTPTAVDQGYKLGAGDQIRVIVFGEDELSGQFNVDGSGFVNFPMIGQVKAAGLTISDLVRAITDKLSEGYLKDPRVSVEVTNYRPFYIIGEVNKPGEYPYVSGMNVINAVALAGGYTYRADDNEIYVRRKGSSTEVKEPADETTQIEPGDIIRVPERFF